jgi:hypothetical protein
MRVSHDHHPTAKTNETHRVCRAHRLRLLIKLALIQKPWGTGQTRDFDGIEPMVYIGQYEMIWWDYGYHTYCYLTAESYPFPVWRLDYNVDYRFLRWRCLKAMPSQFQKAVNYIIDSWRYLRQAERRIGFCRGLKPLVRARFCLARLAGNSYCGISIILKKAIKLEIPLSNT